MFNKINFMYILMIFVLIMPNCGKKSKPTEQTDQDTSTYEQHGTINESGGKIQIADADNDLFGSYVNVPEGALEQNTTIEIKPVISNIAFEGDTSGVFVSLEPSGIHFEKPIQIGIPYDKNLDISNLTVYYLDETEDAWRSLPTVSIDQSKNIITAETDHFTYVYAGKTKLQWDIEICRGFNKIAATVKHTTPLKDIKLDWYNANVIPTGCSNYRELLEKYTMLNICPVFKVILKQKKAFSDSELDKRIIHWQVYSETNANRYGVRAHEVQNGVKGDIIYTSEDNLTMDDIENVFSNSPLVIYFNNVEPNSEIDYYIEVLLCFFDSFDIGYGHGFSYSTDQSHQKWTDMDPVPDIDGDGIINDYDESNNMIEKPTLVAPSNISIIDNNVPYFDWVEVNGAVSYELKLSKYPSFYILERNPDTIVSSHYQPGDALSDGTFYWMVRAQDQLDSWGPWSDVWQFTIETSTNTPPVASFTIQPEAGNTSTLFSFDASACYDAEDPAGSLQVQWDWTNDGVPDELFSTNMTATHRFFNSGIYTIQLEVMDTGGLKDTETQQITVTSSSGETDIMTDREGNEYRIVKIGDQWWMAENLRVTTYRNGEPIPKVTDNSEWKNLSTGAYCIYDNSESNGDTYGFLYNGYAVSDANNIAPEGWHVPTDTEWRTLLDHIGGSIAGDKLREAGTEHWNSPNNSTDEYLFSALPAGAITDFGTFDLIGTTAHLWTSTEANSNQFYIYYMDYRFSDVRRNPYHKKNGFSIRCIKD